MPIGRATATDAGRLPGITPAIIPGMTPGITGTIPGTTAIMATTAAGIRLGTMVATIVPGDIGDGTDRATMPAVTTVRTETTSVSFAAILLPAIELTIMVIT